MRSNLMLEQSQWTFCCRFSIRPMFFFFGSACSVCLFGFACEFASNGKSARDAQITNTSINWCVRALCISCDLAKPKIQNADRNGNVRVRMAVIVSSRHSAHEYSDARLFARLINFYIYDLTFKLNNMHYKRIYELTQIYSSMPCTSLLCGIGVEAVQLLRITPPFTCQHQLKYVHTLFKQQVKNRNVFRVDGKNDFPLHSHTVHGPLFAPSQTNCIQYICIWRWATVIETECRVLRFIFNIVFTFGFFFSTRAMMMRVRISLHRYCNRDRRYPNPTSKPNKMFSNLNYILSYLRRINICIWKRFTWICGHIQSDRHKRKWNWGKAKNQKKKIVL